MNIRRQEKNDCSGIAHVVTLAWNEAYKDIVSRDFLDNLYVTEHDRADEAYKKFNKRYNHQFVLDDNGEVVGFVNVGRAFDEEFDGYGEIFALYIINGYKNKGYGEELFKTGISELKDMGFDKVIVGCLENNPSNEFYKHLGGKFIKKRMFEKINIMENVYEFDV